MSSVALPCFFAESLTFIVRCVFSDRVVHDQPHYLHLRKLNFVSILIMYLFFSEDSIESSKHARSVSICGSSVKLKLVFWICN